MGDVALAANSIMRLKWQLIRKSTVTDNQRRQKQLQKQQEETPADVGAVSGLLDGCLTVLLAAGVEYHVQVRPREQHCTAAVCSIFPGTPAPSATNLAISKQDVC